ncbi:dienelactone hydrolase family protein [candidate division KSB1 bacterium]
MGKNVLLTTVVMLCMISGALPVLYSAQGGKADINYNNMPAVMPETKQLTWDSDLSAKMMDGAHEFIEREIDKSAADRAKFWSRNFSSHEAYEQSVEPNRRRFMKYIGVEDKSKPPSNYSVGLKDKHPPVLMERYSINNDSELIAETSTYKVYQVRWPVLNRIYGEGLLLVPEKKPAAHIIALPDADQTPEQLVGLSSGIAPESQFARRLAEKGFQVLVPVIISRSFLFTGKAGQQTYRERIYRQAFQMGRHIIGYEVQKVLSAVDWFKQTSGKDAKIGVAGYCEGGLIAFYSAAVDRRIDAVFVSGYFNSRQRVWDEPIYRNVWALLTEFGDAETASLIAPRPMIIEHSYVPGIVEQIEAFSKNPPLVNGVPLTGYKGRLETPEFETMQTEFKRIDELIKPGFQQRHLISGKNNKPVSFGSEAALEKFALLLGHNSSMQISSEIPSDTRSSFDVEERQIRQVRELEDHVQWLLRDSDYERNKFFLHNVMPEFSQRSWSTKPYHPYYSPERLIEKGKEYRKYFREEILGKFDNEMLPPNARTRKIYDKERWTGYEVVLDVYPELFAWGILLIPKDIKPGERRPVVVCQHGRSRTPDIMVEGNSTAYNDVAARLADQGFITFAPHNLYRGEDRYRWLDRKANNVKKTLFSFIISQHDQLLQWLGTLPFVDKSRMAFYGLSYGGETAMRVPSVLEDYCLSICSGDFGDWTRIIVDTHYPGFMDSMEWEMPYFDMGSKFSYAEMAYLIFPRPFMVERGHDDLCQPDEWIGYEYAKVKYVYDQFNLGDKTEIEYFNGGHSMRCEGTFKFLHKHLNWP